LVFGVAAGAALAQTGGASAPQANTANERLLEELGQITDDAERNRTASTGIIVQLRDLARRYAWPWSRQIISDSFEDGNYSANPAWTVVSGAFTPAYGELISRHTAPAAATQQTQQGNPNDIGAAIFGAVIQGLSQNQGQGQGQGQGPGPATQIAPAQARIQLNAQIPNAFATVVTLRTQSLAAGGFEFGPGGEPGGSGYRVAIAPGTATLLRVGAAGSAIVDRVTLPAGLENGQDHTLELTRDATGELFIGLDGTELIRVRDMGIRDPFDRFIFVNNSGEYRIQSVAIYGTP